MLVCWIVVFVREMQPSPQLATTNLSEIPVTPVTVHVTTLHPPRYTAMKLVRFVSKSNLWRLRARLTNLLDS